MTRREWLHAAGAVAGPAALAFGAPRLLASARPAAFVPADQAVATDAVAKMRAQMGAAPIETRKLSDQLTMLSGPGGNVVVLAGPQGKIVVDGFVQPAWPALKKILDGLGPAPIRSLVDTHWHLDHADNNANFRAAGASIVAHQNTTRRLSQTNELMGMRFPPVPDAALPTLTFATSQQLSLNGEHVSIAYLGPAHTDTDVLVHFTKANVLHLGDVFFNGLYPFIDASTGGRIGGMIAGADAALKLATSRSLIVPGHGPLGDAASLKRYRDMLVAVRDRVQALKAAGRSLAEVQAAKPTASYDAAFGGGMLTPADFVGLVYATL